MRLRRLHSVLSIPADRDTPIRLRHLSFREFLTHPDRKEKHQFWIDETKAHGMIAKQCIRRLGTLRLNLCRITRPGLKRAEISEEKVAEFIAADVAYACRYWVYHLSQSGQHIHDNDDVFEFLHSHFLHWLEALSWLGRLSGAITDIYTLQSLVVNVSLISTIVQKLNNSR